MTNQRERIYALLVELNPVPDPAKARELIDRRRGHLKIVEPRRHDMNEREIPSVSPDRRGPRFLVPALAGVAVLVVGGLFLANLGSDSEKPSTTQLPAAPATTATPATTAVPATTATGPPTVTFTGNECVYSGEDTFSMGLVEFTYNNESSVDMVVYVLRAATTTTLEDLAADTALFPPTEVWPPVPAAVINNATISTRVVDAGTEATHNIVFERAFAMGAVCWPLDSSPALPAGGLFTVEE